MSADWLPPLGNPRSPAPGDNRWRGSRLLYSGVRAARCRWGNARRLATVPLVFVPTLAPICRRKPFVGQPSAGCRAGAKCDQLHGVPSHLV